MGCTPSFINKIIRKWAATRHKLSNTVICKPVCFFFSEFVRAWWVAKEAGVFLSCCHCYWQHYYHCKAMVSELCWVRDSSESLIRGKDVRKIPMYIFASNCAYKSPETCLDRWPFLDPRLRDLAIRRQLNFLFMFQSVFCFALLCLVLI